mmetsp:Transcript_88264/g.248513  ORF Transcript_88264/g.248513 Transcript_88264/m.248513 type:complete len:685 (-) Transcript_88264:94-2148(-)
MPRPLLDRSSPATCQGFRQLEGIELATMVADLSHQMLATRQLMCELFGRLEQQCAEHMEAQRHYVERVVTSRCERQVPPYSDQAVVPSKASSTNADEADAFYSAHISAAPEADANNADEDSSNAAEPMHVGVSTKEKLMACLDVAHDCDPVNADTVKELLRKRNRYDTPHGACIDALFKKTSSVQRQDSKFFHEGSGESFMTFKEFSSVVLQPDAAVDLGPDVIAVLKLVKELAMQDDARDVVKAAMGIEDLGDLDMAKRAFDRVLELVMTIVVFLNVVSLGWFAKAKGHELEVAAAFELVFSSAFVLEIVIKVSRRGFLSYIGGAERFWNWFDMGICLFGVADTCTTIVVLQSGRFRSSSVVALRMIRLFKVLKLARFFRILRFREMKLFVNGLIGMLKTVSAAFVLLFLVVYGFGVTLVQFVDVADSQVAPREDLLFDTVPRCMFTVFRCLMAGDCSTINGTPIALHMSDSVGTLFTVAFSAAFILMHYGISSLIIALVVDNTLHAAQQSEFRQSITAAAKLNTARKLRELASVLKEMQPGLDNCSDLLFMTREEFNIAIRQKGVKRLLEELDIDEKDQINLFDALDADRNRRLEIDELIHGVLKLGGEARKVDAVAGRVMLDHVSGQVSALGSRISRNNDEMVANLDRLLDSVLAAVAKLECGIRRISDGVHDTLERSLRQ